MFTKLTQLISEINQFEDCSACPYSDKCRKGTSNRTIRINEELTAIHREVIENLESTHGRAVKDESKHTSRGSIWRNKMGQSLQTCTEKRVKSGNF